jgi:hypothetical protein
LQAEIWLSFVLDITLASASSGHIAILEGDLASLNGSDERLH